MRSKGPWIVVSLATGRPIKGPGPRFGHRGETSYAAAARACRAMNAKAGTPVATVREAAAA